MSAWVWVFVRAVAFQVMAVVCLLVDKPVGVVLGVLAAGVAVCTAWRAGTEWEEPTAPRAAERRGR